MSVHSLSVGARFVTTLQSARLTAPLSRLCTSMPPPIWRSARPGPARIGQGAGEQQAQVLLGREHRERIGIGIGRDDDFGEDAG